MKLLKTVFVNGGLLLSIIFLFSFCNNSQRSKSENSTVDVTVEDEYWKQSLASDSLSWLENWIDDSARTDSAQYKYENGNLKFWTSEGSRERPKVTHKYRNWTTGQYFWRVYVPKMGMYNRASIGAFLYYDGDHELDFEIGSGRKEIRESVNAQEDEVVMYLTSQEFPAHQSIHPIKTDQWYDLSIRLTETEDGKYFLEWIVNDVIMDSVKLEYGPEIEFGIHCSLENIQFMGDVYATQDHYTLFNSVGYKKVD